ncbi:beta-ketoacyl-ACP synthase 3 [Streptomyces longwoodensis]|uniref:beta-ketoacyl-ACP synthase 3 n=1 Tax=Streptomyces longwoodensis TaxID=68231 RepID=UPI0033EE8BC4
MFNAPDREPYGRRPPGSRIAGLGHYRPDRVMRSETVASRLGVDASWIRDRTGIEERRVAGPRETVVTMGVAAARAALASTAGTVGDIDTVITATSTALSPIPSAAAQVAAGSGVTGAAAFDLNTACAGFCYALACADSLIRSGTSRGVLVVAADKSTDWVDWDDRDTAILFGDGAGAAVVVPADVPHIGPVVWGSVGEKHRAVYIDEGHRTFRQDGRSVFRWATGLGPVVRGICARTGIDPADLAAFVPHQANLRIVSALARELEAGKAVVAEDVRWSGNTIAATVPLALSRMAEAGELPLGKPVLLFGFGAGLAYAGQIVVL